MTLSAEFRCFGYSETSGGSVMSDLITRLNKTYLKVKFGCNSIGTNLLSIMGVNINASHDYSSDFRDIEFWIMENCIPGRARFILNGRAHDSQ